MHGELSQERNAALGSEVEERLEYAREMLRKTDKSLQEIKMQRHAQQAPFCISLDFRKALKTYFVNDMQKFFLLKQFSI